MRINNHRRGIAWAVKRGFDVVISVIALLLSAPGSPFALAVRSKGPGIYFAAALGSDGVLDCLKFRSMRLRIGRVSDAVVNRQRPPSGKIGRFYAILPG